MRGRLPNHSANKFLATANQDKGSNHNVLGKRGVRRKNLRSSRSPIEDFDYRGILELCGPPVIEITSASMASEYTSFADLIKKKRCVSPVPAADATVRSYREC